MPRAQNGQTTTDKPRAPRDNARLLDNAQLMRDGLQLRLDRMEVELRRLLGGHQNANQIMQLLTRSGDGYAALTVKATELDAAILRYTVALAEQQRDANVQAVSEIPVNPDDVSKDVEPVNPDDVSKDVESEKPAVSNGKVAVAA